MQQRTWLGSATVLLAVTLVAAGTTMAARQDPPPTPNFTGEGLPDAPGKDAMVRVCAICHEPRRAASLRLTREGWELVVADMVKRGAKGSDQDIAAVIDYLVANFLGESPRPINLNNAPAIDLESVVGLLRSEARALIAYREKKGACKTVDDLKKVPGVPFKKLDAARDRVVCY